MKLTKHAKTDGRAEPAAAETLITPGAAKGRPTPKRRDSQGKRGLFPLMIASAFIPALAVVQIVVLVVFLALLVEWYFVGRRIRAMALKRFGEAQGGNMTIGFYAGSRAYLPRRWRLPAPQVERGSTI